MFSSLLGLWRLIIQHLTCVDFYLDQQIHNVSGHLLYQDVNHSQDLSLGSGQSGGVNVLLRLRVSLSCVVPMNLGNKHAYMYLLQLQEEPMKHRRRETFKNIPLGPEIAVGARGFRASMCTLAKNVA